MTINIKQVVFDCILPLFCDQCIQFSFGSFEAKYLNLASHLPN